MKSISKIRGCCLPLLCGLLLFSCKDEIINGELGESGIAKVNVIDAVVTGGLAKVNVSRKKINWSSVPDNQKLGEWTLGKLFMVPAGQNTVMQVVPVSDTTKMWYDHTTQLSAGKVYTLYLSGTPGNVNTLLHEETDFPGYIVRDVAKRTPAADSIVNVRFVNLSPSGPKVDINIKGQSAVLASGLAYQSFTDFKAYPATNGLDYIYFEIRNSSDKSLITTYGLPAYYFRFKSIAVIMKGIYAGTGVPYVDQYGVDAVAYE